MLTSGHVYTGSGQESLAVRTSVPGPPFRFASPKPASIPESASPTTVWYHLKTSS